MENEVFVYKVRFHFFNLLLPILAFLLGGYCIYYGKYNEFVADKLVIVKENKPGVMNKVNDFFFKRLVANEEAALKQSKVRKGQIFLVLGFLLLIPLFYTVWHYSFRKAIITNKRVYIRQGILFKSMQNILVSKVAAITIKQSIIQKLFNIGHLYIHGGSGPAVKLKNAKSPFVIKDHVERLATINP